MENKQNLCNGKVQPEYEFDDRYYLVGYWRQDCDSKSYDGPLPSPHIENSYYEYGIYKKPVRYLKIK